MKTEDIKNKEWLRKFLLLTGVIPSAQTYERVISLNDRRKNKGTTSLNIKSTLKLK